MKEAELKPCPFCGGEAELCFENPELVKEDYRKFHIRASVFVKCKRCFFAREKYSAFVDLDIERMELIGSFSESQATKHVVKLWNRRADDEKKRNRPHPEQTKNCYYCEHCIYLGEGGYMCGMNNDIIIENWLPTEDFNSCKGKEFKFI